jgi:hypothetical protein
MVAVLPHDFPDQDVRAVMAATVTGHLARLSPALRRFADCLSPHRRSLDGELCVATHGRRSRARARRRDLHRHAALKLAERAEMATEIEIGRHFVDRLLTDDVAGKDVLKETCMSKWWHSDLLKRVTDQYVQLFGGYGYMLEYPISKTFLDARGPATLKNSLEGCSLHGSYLADIVSAASVDIVSTASPRWTEVRHAGSLSGSEEPLSTAKPPRAPSSPSSDSKGLQILDEIASLGLREIELEYLFIVSHHGF